MDAACLFLCPNLHIMLINLSTLDASNGYWAIHN